MIEDMLLILNADLEDISNLSTPPDIMGDALSFPETKARFYLSRRAWGSSWFSLRGVKVKVIVSKRLSSDWCYLLHQNQSNNFV